MLLQTIQPDRAIPEIGKPRAVRGERDMPETTESMELGTCNRFENVSVQVHDEIVRAIPIFKRLLAHFSAGEYCECLSIRPPARQAGETEQFDGK